MAADAQRLTKLQQQLVAATPLLGGRRRRRAAEQLAALAREASPEAIAALAQALASGADEAVRGIAWNALKDLQSPAAVQALCALWASSRLQELGVLIAECVYVAAAPIELRVLTALAADRLELVTGDSTAVRPLIATRSDRDPLIAERARTALRHLQDPAAIQALCALWASSRIQELGGGTMVWDLRALWASSRLLELGVLIAECGYVAAAPIELRVLSALAADRLDLVTGDSTAVKPLIAARSDRDPLIAERARTALRSLRAGAACDALCRLAVEEGDEAALTIAIQACYAPSDPALHAALLALAARWEELDVSDLDGLHLRVAYEAAAPEVRRRLAAAAREAGRAGWVQVAVGGRQRLRLAQMTRSEWQDVIALLADPARASEAWRLAEEAPPLWGRELLLGIGVAGALPECDREDFARLRALAVRCDEGEIPFSALTSRAATLGGHESSVTSLGVTPDGSLLASGSHDNTIRLWRLPDGECVVTLRGHRDWVEFLAVTPDGSLLASGSSDGTIRLWRLPDGMCVATLRGHESSVTSLTIAPDGSLLTSGSWDSTIRLWHLPDGECVATLRGHENSVEALAVTPDGSLLASGSRDDTIRLWRLPDGECVATLRGHESLVSSLAVTPDGSLLASGSWDETIRLWRSPVAVPAATPVVVLAPDIDRLLALRGDALTERQRAWLDFSLALVDRHRRFDIQVEVSRHIEAGEFDIEIGD